MALKTDFVRKSTEKKIVEQLLVDSFCNVMCVSLCPPSQRKQQKDLLAALQKVVVPIYCTSFLAVEEEKQQKITRVNTDLKSTYIPVWVRTKAASNQEFVSIFNITLKLFNSLQEHFSLDSNINIMGH